MFKKLGKLLSLVLVSLMCFNVSGWTILTEAEERAIRGLLGDIGIGLLTYVVYEEDNIEAIKAEQRLLEKMVIGEMKKDSSYLAKLEYTNRQNLKNLSGQVGELWQKVFGGTLLSTRRRASPSAFSSPRSGQGEKSFLERILALEARLQREGSSEEFLPIMPTTEEALSKVDRLEQLITEQEQRISCFFEKELPQALGTFDQKFQEVQTDFNDSIKSIRETLNELTYNFDNYSNKFDNYSNKKEFKKRFDVRFTKLIQGHKFIQYIAQNIFNPESGFNFTPFDERVNTLIQKTLNNRNIANNTDLSELNHELTALSDSYTHLSKECNQLRADFDAYSASEAFRKRFYEVFPTAFETEIHRDSFNSFFDNKFKQNLTMVLNDKTGNNSLFQWIDARINDALKTNNFVSKTELTDLSTQLNALSQEYNQYKSDFNDTFDTRFNSKFAQAFEQKSTLLPVVQRLLDTFEFAKEKDLRDLSVRVGALEESFKQRDTEITNKFDFINQRVTFIDNKFEDYVSTKSFNSLFQDAFKLAINLENFTERINNIVKNNPDVVPAAGLNRLDKVVVQQGTNINNLQGRMDTAEKNMNQHRDNIQNLVNMANDNMTTIAALGQNVSESTTALSNRINNVDINIQGLDARMATAEGNINTANTDIATLRHDIDVSTTTLRTDLATASNDITTNVANIQSLGNRMDNAE
ncbi:MAG: hypothetical protein LBF23_01855, partial [Endomicrobium sp.]|nr:hypothetical protein [Endomicrobium sp.]